MRSFLPAVLLVVIGCGPASGSGSAPAQAAQAQNERMEAARTGIELEAKPTTMNVALGVPRAEALEIARDAGRTLVLRVEGISVDGQPGLVYDVSVGGRSVGVLSFYGVERVEGEAVSVFAIDDAIAQALQNGDTVPVVFTPKGRIENGREVVTLEGRVSFQRLRIVEEKLPD